MVALEAFVRDDLRAGRLVAPFDLRVPTRGGYYLAYPGNQDLPEHVHAFEEWIVAEARAAEG